MPSSALGHAAAATLESLERRRLLSTTRVTEYDLIAGTEQVLDAGQMLSDQDAAVLDASLAAEGFAGGLDALLASLGSPDDFLNNVNSILDGNVTGGYRPDGLTHGVDDTMFDSKDPVVSGGRSVDAVDDRTRVTDATGFPFSAVGRMQLGCSGAMIGPYHFLTAAHCTLSGSNIRPASQLAVSLGQNGSNDKPYGTAEVTFVRVYDEYRLNGQWEHDWAVMTLDRSIGDYTGYFGYRSYDDLGALNGKDVTILQYPGDKPLGTQWSAEGQVANADAGKVFYNGTLDTAGGSSGSSVWEQLDGDSVPQVLAVHGYGGSSPSGGFNSASRITDRKIGDINLWKLADDAARAPNDLADLTVAASGSDMVLPVGGQFDFGGAVRNTGTAIANDVTFSVYASVDGVLGNGDDILLAEGTTAEVIPFAASSSTSIVGRLPASLGAGVYNIGYVVDAANSVVEISDTNNSALAGTLRVGSADNSGGGGVGDVEPNDGFATAVNLGVLGTTDFSGASISTSSDQDYYKFTAADSGPLTITVNFIDANGDLDTTLYNGPSSSAQIDTSTGTTNIETLNANVVEGQTYYLRVYGWSGATNTYGVNINAPGFDSTGPELADATFVREATQQIRFLFDEALDVAALSAGDLVLDNLSDGSSYDVSQLNFAVAGREAIWATPAGGTLLGNGVWQARIAAADVTDLGGNAATDDASFTFDVLAGDANGDRTVSILDFAVLRSNFGSNGLFSTGDFNYDGTVSILDFAVLRSNFGQSIAIARPTASLFADEESAVI